MLFEKKKQQQKILNVYPSGNVEIKYFNSSLFFPE